MELLMILCIMCLPILIILLVLVAFEHKLNKNSSIIKLLVMNDNLTQDEREKLIRKL